MNEHFIIQLSEQLDSIVGRAKLMALPLMVADALPLIANRGQFVFGFDDATKTDFEDLISKLLKNNKWSEKYSERFLSDRLLDIIAGLMKDRQLNASQACIKKLVAEYENFRKENVVFIPIGGIALNLPEFVVGNIKFRNISRDGNQEPFARLDSHIANTQWTRHHEDMKRRLFGGYSIITWPCPDLVDRSHVIV